MAAPWESVDGDLSRKENYYYTVLNLPKEATSAEIHERHRALSLAFHPDKQEGDELKEIGTKHFLQIQKAYQVLSDPFLRQVYDVLGQEGLNVKWTPEMRALPQEEIRRLLDGVHRDLTRNKLSSGLIGKGHATLVVNAVPTLQPGSHEPRSLPMTVSKTLNYTCETQVKEKTYLGFGTIANTQGQHFNLQYLGTVKHQFSPRLSASMNVNFSAHYVTTCEVAHHGPDHALIVKTVFLPLARHIPQTHISFTRRLFRGRLENGRLNLNIGPTPSIAFLYNTQTIIAGNEKGAEDPSNSMFSLHGFKTVVLESNMGVMFETILPALYTESTLFIAELSTRLKFALQLGFTGSSLTLGGQWSNQSTELGSEVTVGGHGLVWTLNLGYMEQRLTLPIVLSTRLSPGLTLTSIVLPTSFAILGYHFVILPQRRSRRKAYIQTMRKALDEDSEARRERKAVEHLLKEVVRKSIRLETSRDGLIIKEASYGVVDSDDATQKLSIDVKIPMQALVRNSQLYIPGGDSKAALQGFSDPAPFASKSLRVHYSFRGSAHYAEFLDRAPVVLPLSEHRID